MGSVQVTGTIHLQLASPKAQQAGVLTITGSRGSIRLSLQTVPGFQPMSLDITRSLIPNATTLKYTIVSGTGAYRGVHGTGRLSLSVYPNFEPGAPRAPLLGPPVTPGTGTGIQVSGDPFPVGTNHGGSGATGSQPVSVGIPTFLSGQFTLDFLSSNVTVKRNR